MPAREPARSCGCSRIAAGMERSRGSGFSSSARSPRMRPSGKIGYCASSPQKPVARSRRLRRAATYVVVALAGSAAPVTTTAPPSSTGGGGDAPTGGGGDPAVEDSILEHGEGLAPAVAAGASETVETATTNPPDPEDMAGMLSHMSKMLNFKNLKDVDRDGILEADRDGDGILESHVYTKFIHKKLPKWMAKLIPVDSLRESLQEYASTVRVFVNKLWPSENVQETYRYYDFPLACSPDLPIPQFMALGQILKGDRIMSSQMDFKRLPPEFWKVEASLPGSAYVFETPTREICNRGDPTEDQRKGRNPLTVEDVVKLKDAIDEYYVAELLVDSFPVTDFIGLRLSEANAKYYLENESAALEAASAQEKLDPGSSNGVSAGAGAPAGSASSGEGGGGGGAAAAGHVEANTAGSANGLRQIAERMWSHYLNELYHKREGMVDEEVGISAGERAEVLRTSRYFLRTHYGFEVTHQKGEVMQVKLATPLLSEMTEITTFTDHVDARGRIKPDAARNLRFTMSVHWYPSADFGMTRQQALEYQIAHNYSPIVSEEETRERKTHMKVHWFGILNSLAVMGCVSIIVLSVLVRNLQSDLADLISGGTGGTHGPQTSTTSRNGPQTYAKVGAAQAKTLDDLMDFDDEFEFMSHTGWKLLHADVFRPPSFRTLFAPMVGTGTQLGIMSLAVVFLGFLNRGRYSPGAVLSTMAFFYVSSAIVAGYVSGSLYQVLQGERWTLNILLTSLMFALPVFVVWSLLNTIAILYGSSIAVPFGTIFLLLGMWCCVTVPLTVFGGVLGRQVVIKTYFEKSEIASYFPCKTNKLERWIPPSAKTWSRGVLLQYLCCGGLPFLTTYTELHYIFDSVWGNKVYRVYGVLLVTIIFTVLTSCLLAVLFIYYSLNAENYKWWWRSFFSGSSLSFFYYVYCIYYYRHVSYMDSFLQAAFFFLYSFLIAYGLALMFGAITYFACSRFLHYIYARIKSD